MTSVPSAAPPGDTLFCTDTFWNQYGDRVREVAPGIDAVVLSGDEPVPETDIERITMAFFSGDAWPARAASFMRVSLDAANLRWLHSMSAGVDNPVFGMFLERGVRVTTSSGASAEPIAGTVMMYLLALSRGLPQLTRAQAAHEWQPAPYRELAGRSIAVIGYGPIGENVVRLADAFGMQPVIVRRAARGSEPAPVRTLADLDEVVASVDVVVVALPLADETRGLISRDVIERMRPDALFVNVGRGELVDQGALTDALRSGRLGGAGLDVFDREPLPADDPLWDLPNVIITPHNSGTTDGHLERTAQIFVDNVGRFVRGDDLRNEVHANQVQT
jgi:D-2-hydroxyacid dehydrogenase (NADP+)